MGIGAGSNPQHEPYLWVPMGGGKQGHVRMQNTGHSWLQPLEGHRIKCFCEVPSLDHIIFPGHSQDGGKETRPRVQGLLDLDKS